MDTLQFSVTIQASPKKIWQVLWNDTTYRKWTSPFMEGCYAESDWKKGSRIRFLGPSGDGMFSEIEECNPPFTMVFRHLGEVKNFVEMPESDSSRKWHNARESYGISEQKNGTELTVRIDVADDFKTYFEETFPKALQVVRKLSEEPVVITIETEIMAPVARIWKHWTEPAHIMKWNHASDDWHTTQATNNLKVGGKFNSRMEAKDGSMGFDFEGIYTAIEPEKKIEYKMADGRKVTIDFIHQPGGCRVVEAFDAEDENPYDLQRGGWQAILDNFRKNVESK